MHGKIDIHKAGGILIKGRKFLVARSKGKKHFVAPGGKLEVGETPEGSLIRELREELGVIITPQNLREFGTFYASAAEQEDKYLQMNVFLVHQWRGEIQPGSEIEEILWVDSFVPREIQLGSIFEHEVLPRLKRAGLID